MEKENIRSLINSPMKIERGINPNCSEAIVRFRTDKLNQEEEAKLFEVIRAYVDKYNYETSVYRNMIFGIKCITVDGDAPYNDEDGLRGSVRKLKFIKKVEIEKEEEWE